MEQNERSIVDQIVDKLMEQIVMPAPSKKKCSSKKQGGEKTNGNGDDKEVR